MSNPLAVTLHALQAEMVSGNGSPVDLGTGRSAALLVLLIEAITGGATISVFFETSPDQTNWREVGQIANEPLGRVEYAVDTLERYVRARWALPVGVTSATFSVLGAAHQLYATRADLENLVLPPKALVGVEDAIVIPHMVAASEEAEARIAVGYVMPLTAWPVALTRRVCDIAALSVMKRRGFNPESESGQLLIDAAKAAEKWLTDVGKRLIEPPGLVDSDATPLIRGNTPRLSTRTSRGWHDDPYS